MQHLIKLLFSPMAFAVGFLWPLTVQILMLSNALPPTWNVWVVGAVIALPWGLMAQLRGSWIWIK